MSESDDLFITLVVHAESKVGKTTLGSTCPGPILVLDAEAGGFRFVPGRKIVWDPMREDVPVADGTWDICRVVVKDTLVVETCLDYIRRGKHPFHSIVLDSITEYQAYMKRELNANGLLDQQDWGRALTKIEDLVMGFRDVAEAQEQVKVFMIIAATEKRDEKFRPALQGAMKNKLSYKLDITGYLYTAVDGEGETRRGLRVVGNKDTDAGNRLQDYLPAYNGVIWDPNITDIFNHVSNKIKEQ